MKCLWYTIWPTLAVLGVLGCLAGIVWLVATYCGGSGILFLGFTPILIMVVCTLFARWNAYKERD